MMFLPLVRRCAFAAMLVMELLGATTVRAGQVSSAAASTKTATDPRASSLAIAFASQRLAVDLMRFGDRKKDPLALIQAARIQQDIESKLKPDSPMSTRSLLARAQTYAAGRADYMALIQDVQAQGPRGALQGPIVDHLLAPVNILQRLLVSFTGGSPAKFAVRAEDPAKIQVEVLDPSGKNVCAKQAVDASNECSWTPRDTGQYQIRIRNLGENTSELVYFHN